MGGLRLRLFLLSNVRLFGDCPGLLILTASPIEGRPYWRRGILQRHWPLAYALLSGGYYSAKSMRIPRSSRIRALSGFIVGGVLSPGTVSVPGQSSSSSMIPHPQFDEGGAVTRQSGA